ncbi:hypothetical protein Hte_010146 [Hypoxylon texense]
MPEPTLSEIENYLLEAEQIINSQEPPPSRREYAEALELADTATELAIDAQCDEATMTRCKDMQGICHRLLRRSYSKTETYEKFVYDKATSRVGRSPQRGGKLFAVDRGEHVVDALRAAHVGQLLERRASDEDTANRRIRFVDEVGGEPIQQVRYLSDW